MTTVAFTVCYSEQSFGQQSYLLSACYALARALKSKTRMFSTLAAKLKIASKVVFYSIMEVITSITWTVKNGITLKKLKYNKMNPKHKIYMLSALLLIGLAVEATNLQSLFYGFMQVFRPDWYNFFNHLAALGLAAFWLLGIVYNGFYENKVTSWGLAILTMCVSLYVYKEIASFSIENFDFSHRHAVVLLQSVVLPYFVAFYTHQLSEFIRTMPKEIEVILQMIKNGKDIENAISNSPTVNIAPTEQKQLGQRSRMNNAGFSIRPFSKPSPKPNKTTNTPIVEDLTELENEKKS